MGPTNIWGNWLIEILMILVLVIHISNRRDRQLTRDARNCLGDRR